MNKTTARAAAITVDVAHAAFMLMNGSLLYFWTQFVLTGRGLWIILCWLVVLVIAALLQRRFKRCPLTIMSERLRRTYEPDFMMDPGFIAYYGRLLFGPNVKPELLGSISMLSAIVPSILLEAITIAMNMMA